MTSNEYQSIVIGAGAFGGWSAYHLLQRGATVLLCDSWGPGNSRSSSGGETRLIRATYGPDAIFTRMSVRALDLWKYNERRWRRKLYNRTGLIWMVTGDDDSFEQKSLEAFIRSGVAFEQLTVDEAACRFPQIDFDGVHWVIYEHDAGYITARQACQTVVDAFVAQNGAYKQTMAWPGPIENGRMLWVELSDGSRVTADSYLFACGSWLPAIFPETLGDLIQATRQEVFFFGTPEGSELYSDATMPAWVERSSSFFYGIPGNQLRGFKVADDTRGQPFDPTSEDRLPSEEGLLNARRCLERRFPALKDAPVLESRVCQYEDTPDHYFIIDRHPEAENVWIAGGGSGHGFKHGPAVGAYVSGVMLGKAPVESVFALARFAR